MRLTAGFCLLLLLVGCGQLAERSELDRSLATWNALKAEHGGHYRYETRSVSWTGASSVTAFEVQAETVVFRSYRGRYFGDSGEEIIESWTEEGAEVGTHEAG